MAPKIALDSVKAKSGIKKRIGLTLPQKLCIIERHESGVSKNSIMKEGCSTIYKIKKQKEKLQQFVCQSDEQLDRALYMWFCARRSEGKAITDGTLIEKFKDFQRHLGSSDIAIDYNSWDVWLRDFKARHGIRKLDARGESQSADVKVTRGHRDTFQSYVAKHNFGSCRKIVRAAMPRESRVEAEIGNPNESSAEFTRTSVILNLPLDNPIKSSPETGIEEWFNVNANEAVVENSTDNNIIQSVPSSSICKQEESDEGIKEEPDFAMPTWQQAADGLNAFITFVERNNQYEYDRAEILNLHVLLDDFSKKGLELKKQADVPEI